MDNIKTVIILAGGKSKRMGFNKEDIIIGDEYIVHKTIRKLAPIFKEIIVVTNNPLRYKDMGVITTKDTLVSKSPLVGLHAGLLKSSSKFNFLLACDMPIIDVDLIKEIDMLVTNEESINFLNSGYIEPFYGVYNIDLVPKIELAIKEKKYKFTAFIESINSSKISFKINHKNVFQNLNTLDQLKNYRGE